MFELVGSSAVIIIIITVVSTCVCACLHLLLGVVVCVSQWSDRQRHC
jgi:hypothetical protein